MICEQKMLFKGILFPYVEHGFISPEENTVLYDISILKMALVLFLTAQTPRAQ